MTTISESVKSDSKETLKPVKEPRQVSLMFNKADLEAGLDMLDQMEQVPSIQIANGTAVSNLGFTLPEFSRTIEVYRKRLRMLLLKTGQINSDLRVAQQRLEAAKTSKNQKDLERCFREVGWHKERTDEMRVLLGLPMQTKWLTPGQVHDISAEPERDKTLNALEELYYKNRAEGKWPFEQCEKDFGEGYRGWIQWQFENGWLPIEAYRAEKLRLAGGAA